MSERTTVVTNPLPRYRIFCCTKSSQLVHTQLTQPYSLATVFAHGMRPSKISLVPAPPEYRRMSNSFTFASPHIPPGKSCSCITSHLPPQLLSPGLLRGELLSHIRVSCTNSALMRDRLNRAKVPVAPGVLVQLIVATPHDAPRNEVFYAAACCVASRFDGAHRGLIRDLLRSCTVACCVGGK